MSDGELQMFRGTNQIYGPEAGLSEVYIMVARCSTARTEVKFKKGTFPYHPAFCTNTLQRWLRQDRNSKFHTLNCSKQRGNCMYHPIQKQGTAFSYLVYWFPPHEAHYKPIT